MAPSRRAWVRIELDPTRTEWMDAAICKGSDTNAFFMVAHGNDKLAKQAVAAVCAICAGCPVARECAEYAVAIEADGIWGGLTYEQRRRMAVSA